MITELTWKSLTAAVNEMAAPNRFLQRLLFGGRDRTLDTEVIELSTIKDGREIAPFVRKNGEAIPVQGTTKQFRQVEGPNIRIKMPFTPSQVLFERQPGTNVLLPPGQTRNRDRREHIARDLLSMESKVVNAVEWLSAQALQGVISYEVEDGEVFTITSPRDAANNITLSTFWDNADPTLPRPLANFNAAKRVMSGIPGSEGLAVTDAIFGTEAADAFRELAESGNIKVLGLDGRDISAGSLTFVEQYTAEGAIYLGRFGGVDCWEYGRTAQLNGSAVNMIRPKYVEFINRNNAASDRVMYYAAIPDMDAFDAGLLRSRRFAKSWKTKDPSQLWALVHSRPLPWMRKPNATVSMKVVSG